METIYGPGPDENVFIGFQQIPVIDLVNHPPHYKAGGIEVIDVIEAKELGYHLGNTVKYILRAGRKDKATELQDLEKAQWYLNRKIANLKKALKQ